MSLKLSSPHTLAATHLLGDFDCGEPALNDWLKRRAISQNTGVRALLVHALHERAKQFYKHYGFQESPQHPMPLMLRLSTVKT
ncbi:hypothetical protein [Acidithiobacillus concretivorus]|uniref:GNAT family N-acetyltransferase n=1 Tax=Acidithiobacillus concretivorus TaxID=3063952 RepID=A0ABS5ZTD6_9PROT|nr:hypothetical protein [Acidithiobacillus concretivorus]MBU2739956.1 hypothetical protein [Acidithiobacillus concretivorus]